MSLVRTPEELEMLIEDARILGDTAALAYLMEEGGILFEGDIRRTRVWATSDLALIQSGGVTVARRHPDRTWRIAIALAGADLTTKGNHE